MTSLRNPPSRLSLLLTEIQTPSVGLCYVIGRSATKRRSLVYKPFVLSPHWSLTTPLRLTHHYISSDKGVFEPSYRDSLVCNSCANLARRFQQHYKRSRSGYPNAWYPAPLLLPLTMCEHYLWPTQYIFINEF